MSGAAHEHELIIVRRHEEEEHAHHSSAWKVAHADFMTAMMAFFLIMWLINVTDDEVRKGISQYFNPIHLSSGTVEMKGLNAPSDDAGKNGSKVGHSDTPANINPVQLTAGKPDPIALSEAEKALAAAQAAATAVAPNAAAAASGAGAADAGVTAGRMSTAGSGGAAEQGGGTAGVAVVPTAGGDGADARERAAFQDPYAILARLAEKYTLDHPTSADTVVGDDRQPGVVSGEVDRDPFDPVYWQIQPLPPAKSDTPGSAATSEALPPDAVPDVQAAVPPPATGATGQPAPDAQSGTIANLVAVDGQSAAEATAVAATAPPAGAVAEPPAKATPPPGIAADTIATSEAVSAGIATSVGETMAADASPDVSVKATPEGVLINLTDDAAFSMFAVGSAIPDPKVVVLMERIAKVLGDQKGEVVVRGYTDGRPFRSDTYDNWRLSTARAHMAYYMLTRGGLAEERVVAIEGHADHDLKNPADPFAAENRRIEILLKKGGP